LASANIVGYNTTTVVADQFYMIGVQLADVAGNGISADFNTFLSTTCAPGTYGDGSGDWRSSSPMIQVLQANGQNYSYYYLINDADDGNGNYTATGWVDSDGFNVTGTQVPVGQSFWINSSSAGTFTFGL
jgi:hypothetical protein